MAGNKLLVADDSLTIQKVIRLALSSEGYEIQAVSDGNDAVEQISVYRPDVILIDVSLPSMSAFEVKRAINGLEDLKDVRFILMSSAFEKVDEGQVEEVGFHGRLTKPFDPAHLRQVLVDVLGQPAPNQRPTEAPEATTFMATPPPLPSIPKRPPSLMPQMPQSPAKASGSAKSPGPSIPPPADDWSSSSIEPLEPLESLEPMESDSPIMAPPPPSDVEELWEVTPEGMPEDLPQERRDQTEGDIKHLTESTIRMSGLDDFEWSVSEPSLKPPVHLSDAGDSNFQIEPASSATMAPPFMPEISGVAEASPDPLDAEPTIQTLPPPAIEIAASPADFYREAGAGEGTRRMPSMQPTGASAGTPTSGVIGLSTEQMEEIIRKELRETLQRMAEKMLPELAERVIKAEIHRMLSDT